MLCNNARGRSGLYVERGGELSFFGAAAVCCSERMMFRSSGGDVHQMEGRAHHGDHVADGHAQVHLPERPVDGHVVRAVDQPAQLVAAHLVAHARRLLDGRLHGDELQQRRDHVQPDHQLQQEAQAQHEQLQPNDSGHRRNINWARCLVYLATRVIILLLLRSTHSRYRHNNGSAGLNPPKVRNPDAQDAGNSKISTATTIQYDCSQRCRKYSVLITKTVDT